MIKIRKTGKRALNLDEEKILYGYAFFVGNKWATYCKLQSLVMTALTHRHFAFFY